MGFATTLADARPATLPWRCHVLGSDCDRRSLDSSSASINQSNSAAVSCVPDGGTTVLAAARREGMRNTRLAGQAANAMNHLTA